MSKLCKAQNYMHHLWKIASGKYIKILVILFAGIVSDFLQSVCVFIFGRKEKKKTNRSSTMGGGTSPLLKLASLDQCARLLQRSPELVSEQSN